MNVPIPLRAASILLWISGVGFGVFCLPAIRNLLLGRAIPFFAIARTLLIFISQRSLK